MKWILFIIVVGSQGDSLERLGKYDTMEECFFEWEYVNDILTDKDTKNKINTQIVCIQTTQE